MPPSGGIIFAVLLVVIQPVFPPHCYLHSSFVSFLSRLTRSSFTQYHSLFTINFVLWLTNAISLFVCVVLIRASDMFLTIHDSRFTIHDSRFTVRRSARVELSADGISGNRYLRSGSVRYRESRKVWPVYSGSPMHVIGCAAIPAPDDGQWSSAAVWERKFCMVYGDDIPHSVGRVGDSQVKRYRGVTLSLPPRAR